MVSYIQRGSQFKGSEVKDHSSKGSSGRSQFEGSGGGSHTHVNTQVHLLMVKLAKNTPTFVHIRMFHRAYNGMHAFFRYNVLSTETTKLVH